MFSVPRSGARGADDDPRPPRGRRLGDARALLGITLSPLTTVGGPLVVATCAEFSALLTGRYVEGRRAGLTPSDATALASERTGRAFIASALTTIGGFAVLMFAALPLLRNFGAVVTLNVSVAVLSALVVVPPLARWADERGWFPAAVATPHRLDLSPRRIVAAVAGVALVASAAFLIADGVRSEEESVATAVTVPGTETPATLPPPTTAPPPGAATTVTLVATGDTLPAGPPEKPAGLVAGSVLRHPHRRRGRPRRGPLRGRHARRDHARGGSAGDGHRQLTAPRRGERAARRGRPCVRGPASNARRARLSLSTASLPTRSRG